jgi:hypothetical protein
MFLAVVVYRGKDPRRSARRKGEEDSCRCLLERRQLAEVVGVFLTEFGLAYLRLLPRIQLQGK